MQEGLLLSEGRAPSNEAVCSAESCLAMAHRSELLQLPGCQQPSIVPDSPAGLRAIDRGGLGIIILPDETPHLPLHRRHLSPSPKHSHRSSPVFSPSTESRNREQRHHSSSQVISTEKLFPSLSHELLSDSPDLCLLCGLRAERGVKNAQGVLLCAKQFSSSLPPFCQKVLPAHSHPQSALQLSQGAHVEREPSPCIRDRLKAHLNPITCAFQGSHILRAIVFSFKPFQ